MQTQETWYVLEDGSSANPNDVAPGDDGALRHTDGRAVAMRGTVPHTRGVDPEAERAKAVHKGEKSPNEVREKDGKPSLPNREIVAEEGKKTYRTRETK
jgi:hypothetical protein